MYFIRDNREVRCAAPDHDRRHRQRRGAYAMTEQYNAGRRVRTIADAPTAGRALRLSSANRREFLSYALAASSALFTTVALVTMSAPDPTSDPLVGRLLPSTLNTSTGAKTYPVSGGFAYPRIPAGTFGSTFTLDQKASAFTVDDPPLLIADGKFYVVRSRRMRRSNRHRTRTVRSTLPT
jgi:hypothetical protein